jgi:hypothetical protein
MGLVGIAIIYRPFEISFLAVFPLPIFILGWLYIISDITGLTNVRKHDKSYSSHCRVNRSYRNSSIINAKRKSDIRKGIMTNVILAIITIVIIISYYTFR